MGDPEEMEGTEEPKPSKYIRTDAGTRAARIGP